MGKVIVINDLLFSSSNIGQITLSQDVAVTNLAVTAGYPSRNKIKLSVVYTPANTSEIGVTWSITSGSSYATIDQSGVLSVLDNASSSSVTVRATSIYRPAIYGELTLTVSYTYPSPMDDINVQGLVFAYNFAKYPNGYTGAVDDESGNNVAPTLSGLDKYETAPIFGFVDNALCINSYGMNSSSIKVTFPTISSEGSMTIEMYAHLRSQISYVNGIVNIYGYKGTTTEDSAQSNKGGGAVTALSDNNLRLCMGPYKADYIGPVNVPRVLDAVLPTALEIQGYNINEFNTDLTHIVISTSPTAANVYINGELAIATTNASRTFSSKTLSFFTGNLQADIKWLAAYNRTMEATEVQSNYLVMQDNYDSASSEP